MSINQSAIDLLDQLKGVITQLSSLAYIQPIEVLSGSSLGQHIRHTLEFFICLQDAHINGEINYDTRKHDRFLEEDEKLAAKITDSIKEHIEKHPDDFELIMKANYEVNGNETLSIKTTYHRELAYNIEHAIHHMALIKIGLATSFPHVKLPEHFGVASSTVRYQNANHS